MRTFQKFNYMFFCCLAGLLPFCAFAQEALPEIRCDMSKKEFEAIAEFLDSAVDKAMALEELVVREYNGGSREKALEMRDRCYGMGRSYCNSVDYKPGTNELFCYLMEERNKLAKEINPPYPWPFDCHFPVIKKIEAVSVYLGHLQKLTGGAINTCGTIHGHKWNSINEVLQRASYYPSEISELTKKKLAYEDCKAFKERHYCEDSPESAFGIEHWATQGIWQKEQYKELLRLRGRATQELMNYYERENLVSTSFKSAAFHIKELEDAFIGHTGVTAVNGYESAYWTLDDLKQYLDDGKLNRKDNAYYSEFTDASDSAILSRFLYLAVVNNYDLAVIKKLIKDGAPTKLSPQFAQKNIANQPIHFETPLMQAAKRPDVLKLLLDNGADPNAQNRFGKTALMYALQEDEPESVDILLEAKANPNLNTFELDAMNNRCVFALKAGSRSPLMYAAWYVLSANTVQALLDAGANLEAEDSKEQTACDYVRKNKGVMEAEKASMRQLLCTPLNKRKIIQ